MERMNQSAVVIQATWRMHRVVQFRKMVKKAEAHYKEREQRLKFIYGDPELFTEEQNKFIIESLEKDVLTADEIFAFKSVISKHFKAKKEAEEAEEAGEAEKAEKAEEDEEDDDDDSCDPDPVYTFKEVTEGTREIDKWGYTSGDYTEVIRYGALQHSRILEIFGDYAMYNDLRRFAVNPED